MKVLFTHEYVRVSTTYPRSLYRPALCTCCKMAGADKTRTLLRQCASSLLSACHRLERGETESSAAHLQTSNASTPNRSASSSVQTNLNATTPNRPPANASQTSLQEHMALFNFKPSSGQKSFAHSGKRKRAGSMPGGNKGPYYVRNTYVDTCIRLLKFHHSRQNPRCPWEDRVGVGWFGREESWIW